MDRPGTATRTVTITLLVSAAVAATIPCAHADNVRLNQSVFSNIYTAQRQNDCRVESHLDPQLVEAARRHAIDVLDHPEVNADIGSDGSTPQQRGEEAGFHGVVSQTVAINPSLAINAMDVLTIWWNDPLTRATMQNCSNTAIGVWSENSLTRSVVVAVYGIPG